MPTVSTEGMPRSFSSSRAIGELVEGEGQDAAQGLIKICRDGDTKALKRLAKDGATIKILKASPMRIYYAKGPANENKRSVMAMPTLNLLYLLQVAGEHAHVETLQELLAIAGAQKTLRDTKLVTPDVVVAAIRSGDPAVLAALAEHDSRALTLGMGHGISPLSEALGDHRQAVANWLVAECVRQPLAGMLHLAAGTGDMRSVQLLLAHGADANVRIPEDAFAPSGATSSTRWTPSHFAASQGDRDILKYLEEHGADPSVIDERGHTPATLLAENSSYRRHEVEPPAASSA